MIAESFAWFASWWAGSAIQVGILVSLFWFATIVAILALVGANRRGRDLDDAEIVAASAPAPLAPATMDHAYMHRDVRKVRGLSS